MNQEISDKRIWAVGGGKGGTGKTFVLCQLAEHLASTGKDVILIDTDLGGANIHSFYNIKNKKNNLTKFFEDKVPLESLALETKTPNLRLIVGSCNSMINDNIKYVQRIKLMKNIKKLNADYILLDLGAGTSHNTIDLFLLAEKLIVVTVPEITAIENLFQFIKNTYFRKLQSVFALYGIKEHAKNIWKHKEENNVSSLFDLIERVKGNFPDIAKLIDDELRDFEINFVLNKVRNFREINEGFSLKSMCIKYIGVNALYSGFVEYDSLFWRNLSLLKLSSSMLISPRIQNEIQTITENIITNNQMQIGGINYV